MMLATFDIFDTTLIRRCGEPDCVFHLLAARLWPDSAMRQTEFLNLRRQASGGMTLAEIYSSPGMERFPEYTAAEMMAAEMALESEQLTVNPMILQKIESLRSEGWKIKFLSDMYLPSEFLTEVLRRERCLNSDEEVIVSCEWHARKDTGSLYRKVREKYNPEKWIHFGDNRRSDYMMARKNGVKATLVDYGYTAIEKRLITDACRLRDGWRMALLAGIMRSVRVKAALAPTATLAADYVAALYVPYVMWLLRRAKEMGIRRLHFLSRDGYIMMKIAEVLAPEDLELNYLFVSRKALMRAYLAEDSAARFVEIADRKSLIRQPVAKLLDRLQLDKQSMEKEYNIVFGYDKINNPDRQEDFLNKIFNNGNFTLQLMARFAEDAALTRMYLSQEGLTDGTPQAMVDIGWLGTSRLMVNRILSTNIPTFYIGVRGDVYGRSCGDFDSYFAAGQLDTAATFLIENYYSASPWPSTIGYCRMQNLEVRPRFNEGQEFEENTIVKINVDTCCKIAGEIEAWSGGDDASLFRLASISIDEIVNMRNPIDIGVLAQSGIFDDGPLVRKLSFLDIISIVCCGAHRTAFDIGSMSFTVGRRITSLLWPIHEQTAKIRHKLHRKLFKYSPF